MKFFLLFCILSSSVYSSADAVVDLNVLPQPDKGLVHETRTEHAITEIHLGNDKSKNKISLYISPSCLHCGRVLVEDLEEFLNDHSGDDFCVVIKLLPTSAKDIFVMKIIQNEAIDESGYYMILKNYIRRVIANINHVKPTAKQIEKFKGSKTDPEMIKFQVEASAFGFSDDKIIKAYPDMAGKFESKLMKKYADEVKYISKIINSKELNLPLVLKDDKVYKNFKDVLNN